MTVTVQWDQDPEKTGLPDAGSDTKQYPDTATSGTVTVTRDGTGESETVDFTLPLTGGGDEGTITPDVTEVDSTGDETARTITVSGEGFAADTAGTVQLMSGPPGEAGDVVDEAEVTTDANGAFTGVTVTVPANQEAGDYHLVATIGDATSDDTAITVTGGAGDVPVVDTDVTEVEAGGTVTVSGSGFPASTEGIAELVPGAPGEAGEAVASVEFTTDSQGAFADAALVVPAGTADGGYHIVVTVADVISDDTELTVGAGTGPVTEPDVSEVEAGGTVTVAGNGFPADTAGTVALVPGAPGEAGEPVVSADITTDANGAFTGAALLVPEGTADGDYHLVTTVGDVVSDDTAITVGAAAAPVLEAVPAEVDSSGDEAARTTLLSGTGLPADTAGTVALHDGAPGSGGTAVVTAEVTTDAQGEFADAALIVPQDQAAGDYHIVGTFGDVTSDDTAFTVTSGAAAGTLTPNVTEVDSSGDEAARTITVDGAGFAADTAGTVALHSGAPGSGGDVVVSADVTTDPEGAFTGAAVIVPEGESAGDYHLVGTFGETVSDDTAITVTGPAALPVPANLAFTDITAEGFTLTSDPVTDASGYQFRARETGTDTWVERPQVTEPLDVWPGAVAATEYEAQVRAMGDGTATGNSPWSESVVGETLPAAQAATTKRTTTKKKK